MPLLNLNRIDWMIVGGESGPKARLMDIRWALDLRVQCKFEGVPFFMKQMGTAWARRQGSRSWKGEHFSEFPEDLQVREYPESL